MEKARKYLKYASTLCFVGMLGIAFVPVIDVNTYRLSVFNIINLMLNGTQKIKLLSEIQTLMNHYMLQYVIMFGIAVALILISAVLCALQEEKIVYKASIIYALVVNVYTSIVMFLYIRTLKGLDFSSMLYSVDISVNFLTVFIWELLTLLTIMVAVMGIQMGPSKEAKVEDKIPEPVEDHRIYFEPEQQPQPEVQDFFEEVPEPVHYEEPQKQFEQAQPVVEPVQDVPVDKPFAGMILNTNQQVLVLDDRKEVYITDNGHVDISSLEIGNVIGKIYYVSEYGEYCVQPLEKTTIFLISGQPLGKDRIYYLPRGTGIYVKEMNTQYALC